VGRVQLTPSGRWQNLLGETWQNLRCTACGHVHHINVAHLKCCQKCPLILPPATLAEQCNMVLPSSAGRNCFKIALHTCMQIEIASSTNFHHAEKINIIFWQSSSIHGEGCIYIQHRIPKAIIRLHTNTDVIYHIKAHSARSAVFNQVRCVRPPLHNIDLLTFKNSS
jgi:hypothetical protein